MDKATVTAVLLMLAPISLAISWTIIRTIVRTLNKVDVAYNGLIAIQAQDQRRRNQVAELQRRVEFIELRLGETDPDTFVRD